MGLLSLVGIGRWFRGSLLAQIGMGVIALFGVWKVNNIIVARKAVAGLHEKSKKEGKARNVKSRKIRNSTTPGNAAKRLRDYARTN